MKNRFDFKIMFLLILIGIISISTIFSKNGFDLTNTSIPEKEIRFGGPGKDGIPSIDTPKFKTAAEMMELKDTDYVMGINLNGITKAYPVKILNWHEIVNDQFDNEAIVITYCPLCGSGMAFKATVNGKRLEFGVSGLLYNSDVLLYDRESESLWSQIKAEAVSGEMLGVKLKIVPIQYTTWINWKTNNPDTLVLDFDTGHFRNYSYDPYQGYENTSRLYFPVDFMHKGLAAKDKVIALEINGLKKAWPFKELEKINGILEDNLSDQSIFITYDRENNSASIRDENGKLLPATTLFWFAWSAFNSDTKIYFFQ